jgi:hypothetical protein
MTSIRRTSSSSQWLNCPPNGRLFCLALGLMLLLFTIRSPGQEISDEDFDKLQREDLSVLGAVVPHYKVTDATPVDALEKIWETVLKRKTATIVIVGNEQSKRTKITLDLKDTSVTQIIGYIAELSGCHWHLRGRYKEALHLEFENVQNDDSGSAVYGAAFALKAEGAKSFGLDLDVSAPNIRPILESFGVSFGEGNKRGIAAYDGVHRSLAVIVPKKEMPFVEALIRLANAGKLRPASKP